MRQDALNLMGTAIETMASLLVLKIDRRGYQDGLARFTRAGSGPSISPDRLFQPLVTS